VRTGSTGARTTGGALPHAARIPTIRADTDHPKQRRMTLLLLEALGAGLIFIGIIWWTMFHGRKNGELPPEENNDKKED
jgi:hypothetical protein